MRLLIMTIFALAVTSTASAFTLTDKYARGWKGPKLKFNINLSNCPSAFNGAFKDAIALWNSVSSSGLTLAKGKTNSSTTPAALYGQTATDSPVIVCDTNFGATISDDQNVIAGVGFSLKSGSHINYGGLILNASAGNASINNMSKTELAIIIAHEIGHVLGFGHSEDTASLMYFDASYKTQLRLSQDDWDAMAYLYPRDELDGDDLMGCGRVGSSGLPPSPSFLILIFILPLLTAVYLRRRRAPYREALI